MSEATTGTVRHVFAFEGRGGFPTWATPGDDVRPRRLTDEQGRLIPEHGRLSPSQVLNYWYDAVREAGLDGWHYYAQTHWRRAVADLEAVFAGRGNGGASCGRVALLGFSNGGDAVFQVAKAFERRGRRIDLVITADPVRKPLRGIGLLGFHKPANVGLWHNFYQRCDRRTMAGLVPIVGRHVDGADTNRRLAAADFPRPMNPAFAHLWIPTHPAVLGTIVEEVEGESGKRKAESGGRC